MEATSYISDDDLLYLSDHDLDAPPTSTPFPYNAQRELSTEEQIELLRLHREQEEAAAAAAAVAQAQTKRSRVVRFAGDSQQAQRPAKKTSVDAHSRTSSKRKNSALRRSS